MGDRCCTLVRGLGICLDSGRESRGIALELILQSPQSLEHWVASVGLVGILLQAADIELVGSSRTGVTGFVRCRTDDLIFDRESRTLLEQRSLTLKRTYDAVHNGPLQTLATILRSLGEEDLPSEKLRSQLKN